MAHDFMLAYRNRLAEPAKPELAEGSAASALEVTVLFTEFPSTVRALAKASDLARDLNARIRLVVPQVVPFPLPLESPPVLLEFNENRFRALAAEQAIETRVEIFLCRDQDVLLKEILPEHSTVVIGVHKRWWPTKENRLARRLLRQGHQTIVVAERPQGVVNTHA